TAPLNGLGLNPNLFAMQVVDSIKLTLEVQCLHQLVTPKREPPVDMDPQGQVLVLARPFIEAELDGEVVAVVIRFQLLPPFCVDGYLVDTIFQGATFNVPLYTIKVTLYNRR